MGFTPGAALELSTLEKWFRVKVEPIFRRSVLMAALKSNGCIEYGAKATGKVINWAPRVRRQKIYPLDAYAVEHSFPVVDDRMKCQLPMVAYGLGLKLTKFDRLANADSETALFNLVMETVNNMAENFVEDFGTKPYLDGAETGSRDLHGFESMFSVSAILADSAMGSPNDTYAGQSTAFGGQGGDWTGTLPNGQGDTEYLCFSPHVWDIANNFWTTNDTKSWATLWQEILNGAMTYQGRLQKRSYDAFLTNSQMFRKMEDSLIGLESVILKPSTSLIDAGFDIRTYKGMDIMHEYNCPDDLGYFVQWDQIALLSMQSQLVAYEKDHKIETSEDLHAADFYGNMRFWTPAYFGKVVEISGGT